MEDASKPRWRLDGVRVVHSGELDINTPQTPGMNSRRGDHKRPRRGG